MEGDRRFSICCCIVQLFIRESDIFSTLLTSFGSIFVRLQAGTRKERKGTTRKMDKISMNKLFHMPFCYLIMPAHSVTGLVIRFYMVVSVVVVVLFATRPVPSCPTII